MEDKLISIIVPIYNAEAYLDSCISSVLNQTYKNIELILVNDGSTDNSLQICNKYKEDKRVKIYSQKNKGQGAARNKGIDVANGFYIGFCDADDTLNEHMYENLCQCAIKYDTDFCSCGHSKLINGKLIKKEVTKGGLVNRKEAVALFTNGKICWSVWDKLFKKDSIKNIRFIEEKINAEDCLFIIDFIRENSKFYWMITGDYYYNLSSENSFTKQTFNLGRLGLIQFYRELYNLNKEYGVNTTMYAESLYLKCLLQLYIHCINNGFVDESTEIFSEMKLNIDKVKKNNCLSKVIKIDYLLSVYFPNLGKFCNKWYK